jgi:hypothetical protein
MVQRFMGEQKAMPSMTVAGNYAGPALPQSHGSAGGSPHDGAKVVIR